MRFHKLRCLDCLVVAFAIGGIFCDTFYFENLRRGLGNKIIPDFKYPSDTYAHPAPLPTDDPRGAALAAVDTPYKAIVQGTKWKGDVKVFDKKFNFGRTRTGHSVTLRAEVGCEVAYLTVESTEAIPILLKGGVGHDHFTVVVKAKPERRLKGRVRAYCRKGQGKRVPEIYIIPTTAPTDTSTYLRL